MEIKWQAGRAIFISTHAVFFKSIKLILFYTINEDNHTAKCKYGGTNEGVMGKLRCEYNGHSYTKIAFRGNCRAP